MALRRSVGIIVVATLGLPGLAMAASPLNGTWKTDPSSFTWSGKPVVYTATDKSFDCVSCVTPTRLPLGGPPQRYSGAPGVVDSLKATKIDAHTIRVTGLSKRVVFGVQTYQVAPDGKTMTLVTDRTTSVPGLPALHETVVFSRKAAGAPGSLPQAGTWVRTGLKTTTAALLDATYRVTGSTIHMTSPGGQSYHATFGGPPVAVKNAPGGLTVSVRKVSDHEIVETEWRGGKVVDVTDTTVSADGKTAVIVDNDSRSGVTSTSTAHKL